MLEHKSMNTLRGLSQTATFWVIKYKQNILNNELNTKMHYVQCSDGKLWNTCQVNENNTLFLITLLNLMNPESNNFSIAIHNNLM